MAEFIIAYHGAKEFETKEAGADNFERYQKWLADLGEAVVNPGMPMGPTKTVTSDGISDTDIETRLNGFTIIKADNLDEACKIASECPFLEIGTLEVAQKMEMHP